MKKLNYLIAALAAALTLGACQVVEIEPETPVMGSQGFTLTASYGDPASKAAFDDGELTMSWTPGDVLYMIDPEGNNPNVKLTTDITEPARTATFHTDEVVATGNYIVVNTQNTLQARLEEYSTLKDSPSGLNDLVRVHGNVVVENGQSRADIILHQLYTMLSFNFKNIPAEFGKSLYLGMAVAAEGLPTLNRGLIGHDGLILEDSGTFVYMLGAIKAEAGYTLIAPADLRNNQIVFFATAGDELSNRHVFEIFKSGTELQAGKCYSIDFDFAAESTKHVTLEHFPGSSGLKLYDADDFLAAALIQWTNSLHLQQDVDFSGKMFLPLKTSFLSGNGYTLSNIQCGLAKCNYVGLLSEGAANNLTIENVRLKGNNFVGAVAGRGSCESCQCIGLVVEGTDCVGGLVGSANDDVKNCSLQDVCSIYGNDYVGGIVGRSTDDAINCVVRCEYCDVHGRNYVGGVAGSAAGAVECCYEGRVVGEIMYVGGVTGEGQCTRCYCIGTVTGYECVGGVSGSSDCTDCYCIGTVTGGQSKSGELSVGGISGTMSDSPNISNCYFSGSVNNHCGICIGTPAADLASTNLTSDTNLYKETDSSLIGHCGIGQDNEFVDFLTDINGNGAYMAIVWPDNEAGCPILKWQYEGFGVDLTIPGFEMVTL